jgi:hypothetical protein
MLYTICLALFLLINGLAQVGVSFHPIVHVIGGVCGIIAGIILLIGIV